MKKILVFCIICFTALTIIIACSEKNLRRGSKVARNLGVTSTEEECRQRAANCPGYEWTRSTGNCFCGETPR